MKWRPWLIALAVVVGVRVLLVFWPLAGRGGP
jgi:hypothetical protein